MSTRDVPLLAVALLATGCFGSSIRGDLGRVRDLARLPTASDLDGSRVAAEAAEVAAVLAGPLDVEAAVRAALLGNRELRATLRELGVERGLLVQAGLLPNPTVEVEVMPEVNSEVALRLEVDLTGILLAPLKSSAARSELDAARFRAAAAVVATGFEARAAFWSFVAAEEKLKLGQRSLEAFAAARDAADALGRAGNVPDLQIAAEAAAYEDARLSVAALELERTRARERLHRLFGVHGAATEWRARGGLPPLPVAPPVLDDLESAAVDRSLELSELRSRLQAHGKRADLARASKLVPDAAVDVHVLAGGDLRSHTGRDYQVGAGIKLGLPVFDQGQGLAKAHEARFDGELERFHGAAAGVRSSARLLKAEVESAFARARHVDATLLPARKRVTREAVLQSSAMQIGVFTLLAAKRAELEAEMARVDAVRDYLVAVGAAEALRSGKRVELGAGVAAAPMGRPAASEGGH